MRYPTKIVLTGAVVGLLTSFSAAIAQDKARDNSNDKDDLEAAVEAIKQVRAEVEDLKREGQAWTKVRASIKKDQVQTVDKMMRSSKELRSSKLGARLEGFRKAGKTCEAPMLSPRKALMKSDARLVSLKNSYAMQGSSDTGPIAINGTCKSAKGAGVDKLRSRAKSLRRTSKAQPRLKSLNCPYTVIKTEYGKEMTFSKYGCSYTITAICSKDTTPCPTDAKLADLAEDIVLVNGD
ncbi:MAG: hypothetical protein V3V30_00045 [Parvularculaceae bacterium]